MIHTKKYWNKILMAGNFICVHLITLEEPFKILMHYTNRKSCSLVAQSWKQYHDSYPLFWQVECASPKINPIDKKLKEEGVLPCSSSHHIINRNSFFITFIFNICFLFKISISFFNNKFIGDRALYFFQFTFIRLS